MKTLKITLSALILALASTTYSQIGELKDLLFGDKTEYVLAYYELPAPEIVAEAEAAARLVTKTIHSGSVDVIYELEMGVENYMNGSYETDSELDEIPVEPWMTTPFECTENTDELEVEPWMCTPFEIK